jgi:guanine deaminase
MKSRQIYLGTFMSPVSDTFAHYFPQGALYTELDPVKKAFKITSLIHQHDMNLEDLNPNSEYDIFDLSGNLIIPGLMDLHFHWVQDDVRLMPKKNLLEWLKQFTWPFEAKFQDEAWALNQAEHFFPRILRAGTLGGACYSSIHSKALEIAFQEVSREGGDFILGNVLMTMNSPEELTQTEEEALQSVEHFSKIHQENYALTPRFALTCHPHVMKQAAQMARLNNSFIQTHLSETPEEVKFTVETFLKFNEFKKYNNNQNAQGPHLTYTEIYDECEILGPKTILGHAIYLEDKEWEILKQKGSAVAHCPTSNAPVDQGGLGSGLCPISKLNDFKIPWGLGSDIGGGPFLSMLDVINSFVTQHRQNLQNNHLEDNFLPTYTMGIYRATLASSQILQQDLLLGNFERGKLANFIALPLGDCEPSKDPKFSHDLEKLLEKLFSKWFKDRDLQDFIPTNICLKGTLKKFT